MKAFSKIFLLLVIVALPSCAVEMEMRVDAKRYMAIADAHRAYVAADNNLTPQQKQDRFDLLLAWKNSFPAGYLTNATTSTQPSR